MIYEITGVRVYSGVINLEMTSVTLRLNLAKNNNIYLHGHAFNRQTTKVIPYRA